MREFREWGITASSGAAHAMFGGTFGDAKPYQVSFVLPATVPFAPVAHPTPVPFPPVGTFDSFSGTPGRDHLIGTANADSFDVSQGGNDTIEGGAGDDAVYFGAAFTAKDSVDGGSEVSSSGDFIELEGDYSAGLKIGASTLTNVEVVWMYGADQGGGGGNYSIKLNDASVTAGALMEWEGFQLSSGANHFDIDGSAETDGDLFLGAYGRGSDTIIGGGGNDLINGGAGGTDVLDGGAGWNRVSFSRSTTGVTVSLKLQGTAQDVGGGWIVTLKHFQAINGSSHNDTLIGNNEANYIYTGSGSDIVYGGKGDDTVVFAGNFAGTPNALTATGDAGSDTLAFFSFHPAPIIFSLALQGTAQQIASDGLLTATKFENVAGTSGFDDALTGDGGDNSLYGDGGDDTLGGGKGNDSLYGDRGYGLLASDARNIGASGLGSFDRGSGDDILQGGAGDDLLDGGVGIDTADYSDAVGGGVVVDLNILTSQAVGGGLGDDTLIGIENLIGSDFDDTLTGDANANALVGGAGNDTMLGGDGTDVIGGGDGDDHAQGGDGDDAIAGNQGADTIDGGSGRDVMYGDDTTQIVATAFHLGSSTADGTPGDGFSERGVLSPDGSKLAFVSWSDNLDGVDPSEFNEDLFIKDLVTGEIKRITGTTDLPNTLTVRSSFSADGTKLVFQNIDDDGFGISRIYVYDLATEALALVSSDSAGVPSDGQSYDAVFMPDGNHVIFSSTGDNVVDGVIGGIFEKDLTTGAVSAVIEDNATGRSFNPLLSADGTKMLFLSQMSDLVPDDNNGTSDAFIKDLTTGDVIRVSTASDGSELTSGVDELAFSADGQHVVFTAGTGLGYGAVFLKDLVSGELTCVSQNRDGEIANDDSRRPKISPDGRHVAFVSDADNLVDGDTDGVEDLFFYDTATGELTRLTIPNGDQLRGPPNFTFSADGSQIVVTAGGSQHGLDDGAQIYIVDLDFSGAGGNDTINGFSGDDVLIGGGGADTMNGGGGNDVFRYMLVSDSTGAGFDTIVGFDGARDAIDVALVSAVDAAIGGGSLSNATFDADLVAAADAAHLGAHHAVLFTADAGGRAGQTFLVIDGNDTAGYQAGEDFVIRLQGAVSMSGFDADNFI